MPVPEVHQHADLYSGFLGVGAVSAALFQRERTGAGQHLDLSLAEALLYASDQIAIDLVDADGPREFDTWTYPVVTLESGETVCMVGNPLRLFDRWMTALGAQPTDPRPTDERAARTAVERAAAAAFTDAATLQATLTDHGLVAAAVQSAAALLASEWAAHRSVLGLAAPGVRVPAAPWRSSGASIGIRERARAGRGHRACPRGAARPTAQDVEALMDTGVVRGQHAMSGRSRSTVRTVPASSELTAAGGDMELNPFDHSFQSNPYPTYEWLREEAPVYYNERLDFWALSRFDDVLAALHDTATYTSSKGVALEDDGQGASKSMIHMDPPDHTQMRKVVARRFTPRRIAELEPTVRTWARELVAALDGRTQFDVVTDYAALLPATVISVMLGIPEDEHDHVRVWTDDYLTRPEDRIDHTVDSREAEGKLVGLAATYAAARRADPPTTS